MPNPSLQLKYANPKAKCQRRPNHPHVTCQPSNGSTFFAKFQHLWNPYIQFLSKASTDFYLVLVLRSSPFKVGGTVTTLRKDPSQFVFMAIEASSNIWPV
ncbi:hypothetical protein O181_062325 [Austropuccinia psidii MF-1]|uniref:Uncharacterized protein n=1 Tax=Austropuccinia psidii MF-1 TaxID=1389203 RepID=A0A9Q3I188_9BASI|nr:hypothetical protein [Austropuccinia psidii MF-1]